MDTIKSEIDAILVATFGPHTKNMFTAKYHSSTDSEYLKEAEILVMKFCGESKGKLKMQPIYDKYAGKIK